MRELAKVSEDIIGHCPVCDKEYGKDNPMVRVFNHEACADCWERFMTKIWNERKHFGGIK